MIATATASRCRVEICDDVAESFKIVESGRDRLEVFFDLSRLVRLVNRPGNDLRSSVSLRSDVTGGVTIVFHCHCPALPAGAVACDDKLRQINRALQDIESMIWNEPRPSGAADRHVAGGAA